MFLFVPHAPSISSAKFDILNNNRTH